MAVVKREKHATQFQELSELLQKRTGPREVENNFQNYLTLAKIDDGEVTKEPTIVHSNDYTGRIKLKKYKQLSPRGCVEETTGIREC